MSSYANLLLPILGVEDGSVPLGPAAVAQLDELKLIQYLRDLSAQRTDYFTSGTAVAQRARASRVKAQLESLKLLGDTKLSLMGLEAKSQQAALKDLTTASSRLETTVRRLDKSVTPDAAKVTQLLTRTQQQTPSQQLLAFASNPFFGERPGVTMSPEKTYATLLELSRQGLFKINPTNGNVGEVEGVNLGDQTKLAVQDLLQATAPAYRKAVGQRDLATGVRGQMQGAIDTIQTQGRLSTEEAAALEGQLQAGITQVMGGIGDAGELKAERDQLLAGDESLRQLNRLQERIEAQLDRAPSDDTRIARLIGDPRFQLWAEANGIKIGSVDIDPETGRPITSTYRPAAADKGALVKFALQNQSGLDLTAKRQGRLVRLKDEGAYTSDPLDAADVSEAERAVVRGIRAGTVGSFRVDDVGLVFHDTESGKYTALSDDGTYREVPAQGGRTLENALKALSRDELLKEMAAGKAEAEALTQKYPVEQGIGEQEYREIKPNARDIARGKIRLQSVTTGEIVERDIDGYRESIEVIEGVRPELGDRIRAGRDRRLEQRGRRDAGVELTEEEDLDPTGPELASMREREGEDGLQDQLDKAREESEEARPGALQAAAPVEAAKLAAEKAQGELDTARTALLAVLNPGVRFATAEPPLALEKRRERIIKARRAVEQAKSDLADAESRYARSEPGARAIRAQRSVEQLDAKIGDALTESGTRVEEAVGDEPALDPVPVFGTGESQLKQEDGEPIETGAGLLEASARQRAEPVPKSERPESPVADTMIEAEDVQPTTTGIAARTKAADKTGTRDPSYQTKFQRFMQRMGLLRGREQVGPPVEPEENIKTRAPRSPSRSTGGEVTTPPQVREADPKTGERTGRVLGPSVMSEEAFAELKKRRAKKAEVEDDEFKLEGGEQKTVSPYDDAELEFGGAEVAAPTRGLPPATRKGMEESITVDGMEALRQAEKAAARRKALEEAAEAVRTAEGE